MSPCEETLTELKHLRLTHAALQAKLVQVEQERDQAYLERNHLVAVLAHFYPSGTRPTAIEGWEAQWQGCVYIDLPDNGQISFHYHDSQADLFADLPAYTKPFDGHEKGTVLALLRKLWTWNLLIPYSWLTFWIEAARNEEQPSGHETLRRLELALMRYHIAKVRKCDPQDI